MIFPMRRSGRARSIALSYRRPGSTPSGEEHHTRAKAKALTEANNGESFVLGPEQREGHWRTGRPLPEAVVALRDFQTPHRQRIGHMRARHASR